MLVIVIVIVIVLLEKERPKTLSLQFFPFSLPPLTEDIERLNTMRSLNAKKTRDIVMVKRKIDEIPSRTESTQYQQALLDLYEQVIVLF